MKRVFLVLFSFLVSVLCMACAGADDANQPVTDANSQTVSEMQADNNPAPADEPVPVFTDAQAAFEAGNKYFEANELEKAAEALRQAVKLNPDLAEAHFKLGISYSLIDKDTEKEAPAETPAKKPKKGAKEEIKLNRSQRAFAEAAKAYEKIVKKNPKDDAAFYNLGRSYNKINEDEKAAKALKEAVKLKPEETDYQTELGAILIKLSQYDEAVTALKKAISLDENNYPAHDLLETAEAGQKRINFGIKPKPPEPPPSKQTRPRPKENSEPKTTPAPTVAAPPPSPVKQ